MGCTVSNVKLRLKNRKSSRYQQSQVTQIDLQQVYDEAIELCAQDRYGEAEEKLKFVHQYCPQFPYIEMNIRQIKNMIQAKQIYDEGQRLFNRKETKLALESFEQIVQKLELKQFKDVNKLIQICRDEIIKDDQQRKQIEQQSKDIIKKFEKMLKDRQDQLAKLELQNREQQKLIESLKQQNPLENRSTGFTNTLEQSHFPSKAPQQRNIHTSYQKQTPLYPRQRLAPIKQTSSTSIFNKIPIYYVCQKNPKCKGLIGNSAFKHQKCGTTAFFHADGKVSCEKQCATFSLKEAGFSCSNNTVCQINQLNESLGLERINDMAQLADFVEDCLIKDNHAESDQMEFRQKVVSETLLKLFL